MAAFWKENVLFLEHNKLIEVNCIKGYIIHSEWRFDSFSKTFKNEWSI
jgi:hypothetical protein